MQKPSVSCFIKGDYGKRHKVYSANFSITKKQSSEDLRPLLNLGMAEVL